MKPTPMMEDVLACEVETGMPVSEAISRVMLVERLAATPWGTSSLTMSMATDLMMRLPPTAVPREMASEHTIMSHSGKPSALGSEEPKESAIPRRAMDMNFWPSWAPCRNESATAHTSWTAMKKRFALRRLALRHAKLMNFMSTQPRMKPAPREKTMP